MRALFPINHQECFFLCYAFLSHDKIGDITALSQHADEIYQSSLTSSSISNSVDTVDQRCFAIYSLPGSTANLNALNLLLVLKPTVLRHQLHLLAGQFRPLSADIMPSWASRPTAVRLPALGRETGALAGACSFLACWFHTFLSHLSPG